MIANSVGLSKQEITISRYIDIAVGCATIILQIFLLRKEPDFKINVALLVSFLVGFNFNWSTEIKFIDAEIFGGKYTNNVI